MQFKFKAKPIAAAIAAVATAGIFTACGGGGGSVAAVVVPVVAANSPLIGVSMRVDCANGTSGTGTVGTTAAPGVGSISVSGGCTAPIKITAAGKGKMRPLGAKMDGTEDVDYDPAINLPLSAVRTTLPSTTDPAVVTPVTMLVAEKLAPGTPAASVLTALTGASLTAAQGTVAAALGIAASDMSQDYRNASVAAASTRVAEVAARAAAMVVPNGVPLSVTASLPLGAVIARGLANQASTVGAGNMVTATQIANAIKAVDPKLDVTADAAALNAIEQDGGRVNNLVINSQAAAPATSLSEVSSLTATEAAKPANLADKTARAAIYADTVSQLAVATTVVTNFLTPPAPGVTTTTATLPATTTTTSTSSTQKATSTTTTTTTTTTVATTTTTTAAPTTTTAAPTTTTAAPTTTTAAPTTTTAAPTTTTAAPTTTTAAPTTTTAAPTTTTTTTTSTTTTTTAPAFSGVCQVQVATAIGFVTGVSSAASCSSSVYNVDGDGATVTVGPATPTAGKTAIAVGSLATCDPFGAPPAAGATTLTPCKK